MDYKIILMRNAENIPPFVIIMEKVGEVLFI